MMKPVQDHLIKPFQESSLIEFKSRNLLVLVLVLFTAIPIVGCPQQAIEEDMGVEMLPTLLLSSISACTEQILPQTDLSQEGVEPVYLPLDIRITGVTGSVASKLSTKLIFQPERPGACLQSSVLGESGEIDNLRCMNNQSAELKFSGSRRASDAFYCTGTGRFQLKAQTTLNDEARTVIESNPIEVSCLPAQVFEDACERVEEPLEDLGLDVEVGVSDMDMEPEVDLEVTPPPPNSWSLSFSSEMNTQFDLSVQGSAAPYPKNESYTFIVVDDQGQPLPDVSVKFYLDWPLGGERYDECSARCSTITDAELCDRRSSCQWEILSNTENEEEGGAEDEVEDLGEDDESLDQGVDDEAPMMPRGQCVIDTEESGIDERCADEGERCESNYCLPNTVSGLPLILEPLQVFTNRLGEATVGITTAHDPGIYSIRAVATLEGSSKEAHTPNITVWHQIPSQENSSFRCKSPIVAGFFRRYPPDPIGGTDPLGYISYQRPASECVFQSADRFTGRVPNVPIFFMSESGTINQSVLSDAEGQATALWSVGGRSPVNVDPLPFETLPEGADSTNGHNMRDGLVRLIAFTQGEARFIDFSEDVNRDREDLSGDRRYSPDQDIVPPHPEPYIDTNDNGQWDTGEPYHDVNRNQIWDQDVFRRPPNALVGLKCFADWAQARIAQQSTESFSDVCDIAIDDLTRDNPDNLQTTIWGATTVLSVGLPQEQEEVLKAVCRGATCGNQPLCADAISGLDVYLAPGGTVDITYSPRDDNHNCVGVEQVTLESTLDGSTEGIIPVPAQYGITEVNTEPLILDGSQNILPEHCYHASRPTLPTAHNYRVALAYQPPPDAPPFTIAHLNLKLTVPSYLIGDGGTREIYRTLSIGVCGAP